MMNRFHKTEYCWCLNIKSQKYNFPLLNQEYITYKVGPYRWILQETFATNTYNLERIMPIISILRTMTRYYINSR